jgi:hypothetical protein
MTIIQIQKALASQSLEAQEGTLRYLQKLDRLPEKILQDILHLTKNRTYPWANALVTVIIRNPCNDFESLYCFLLTEGELQDQQMAITTCPLWVTWKGSRANKMYAPLLTELMHAQSPWISFMACVFGERLLEIPGDGWMKAALAIEKAEHSEEGGSIRSAAEEFLKKSEFPEVNLRLRKLGRKPLNTKTNFPYTSLIGNSKASF